MRRPDRDHAPSWGETEWLSSPAAEREWQERRTRRLLTVAGLVAAVFAAGVIWVTGGGW